jgi:hypothetical protein
VAKQIEDAGSLNSSAILTIEDEEMRSATGSRSRASAAAAAYQMKMSSPKLIRL